VIRAGDLRTRGIIESPVDTPNDTGEPVRTWATFANAWAEVKPLSGREQFLAQQDASLVQYRVRLRYRAGITPAMRFRVETQILDIEAVLQPDGQRIETQLLCLERKAGA
jgi:SPP1 family predicted phage head-tail adaptor